MFENHLKCHIRVFQFWHFSSTFCRLKLACLLTLFDRKPNGLFLASWMRLFCDFQTLWKRFENIFKLNNFSIFYLGENGGFIAKNWLLLLSAAFSIEQTLYGMSFGFSALYNLGKQQYLAKLQSKSEEETKRQKLELELLKPHEEVAWLKINYSVYSDIVCFILLWFLTRWFLLLKKSVMQLFREAIIL